MNLKSLNIPAFTVIVLYPLLLVALTIIYCNKYTIGSFEIITAVVAYYVSNISVGIGLHRLWAHGSYKTTKAVEFILAIFSAATLQGPILAWASDHMLHHMYTDKEKDPHSAIKYKNKFIGFMWSHMGWMLTQEFASKKIAKIALAKLGRNQIVMWQLKHYWKIAIFMNSLFPFLLGVMIGGDILHGISAFLFFGIGRALQQQATFCVNSIVHLGIGGKEYYYGTARDMWWLFFILLGENWHNFHHAFANDYRNGHKWYHADIHKWIIALMAKVGLAKELVVTSDVRIKAMANEVSKKFQQNQKIILKLDFIEKATLQIQQSALEKLKAAERLAQDFKDNLSNIAEISVNILEYVESLKLSVSNVEEKLILELTNRYENLRKSALMLNISSEAMYGA
jgi:stearoyl-CoA desaturase (delta-9 desaturase)